MELHFPLYDIVCHYCGRTFQSTVVTNCFMFCGNECADKWRKKDAAARQRKADELRALTS